MLTTSCGYYEPESPMTYSECYPSGVETDLIPLDADVRERLIEASRLATVGRLVASFAHQMSSPLAAIALRAESLELTLAEPPASARHGKAERYAHAIGEEAARCRRLLAALREFGGPLDARVREVELASLCRSAVLLVRDEAGRRQVELDLDLDATLPSVRGIGARLGQAVLALVVNAVDASPNGARVRVEARRDREDGWAVVTVTDEGAGLGQEASRRLFQPFASSRPAHSGLGLALLACRAVAEEHGGGLVIGDGGGGGRFVLRLPVAGRHRRESEADAA
jgi:signal transduction histidine kinase